MGCDVSKPRDPSEAPKKSSGDADAEGSRLSVYISIVLTASVIWIPKKTRYVGATKLVFLDSTDFPEREFAFPVYIAEEKVIFYLGGLNKNEKATSEIHLLKVDPQLDGAIFTTLKVCSNV